MAAFWSSVGGKLADRFIALSAPALVFWLGGLLAWSYAHGGLHRLTEPTAWLGRRPTVTQVVVLLIVLFGVTASGLVVTRLTMPVLRLLEGYWPARPAQLKKLRRAQISRQQQKAADQDKAWQSLIQKMQPPPAPAQARETPAQMRARLTTDQLADIGRLDRARHRRPEVPNLFMPTKIGNILRAAEARPEARYGLHAVAVWPRLWLVLPDATRQELVAARAALDGAVAASIWGVLFCAFVPWTFLAPVIGLAVAVVSLTLWVPARAEVFGDLVTAAYDMHRTALYRQLRWPLPDRPAAEIEAGQAITVYLQAGSDALTPAFTPGS